MPLESWDYAPYARAADTQLDDEFAEVLYPGCGGLEKLRGIMEAAEMRILDSQTKQKVRCRTAHAESFHGTAVMLPGELSASAIIALCYRAAACCSAHSVRRCSDGAHCPRRCWLAVEAQQYQPPTQCALCR